MVENLMVMVLTVVFLLGGGYLLLLVLDLLLRWKSGSREDEGLADLFISTQTMNNQPSESERVVDSQNNDSRNSTPT